MIGVRAPLSLLLCQHSVPHQGGLEVERVDIHYLENATNTGIPTNPNPC